MTIYDTLEGGEADSTVILEIFTGDVDTMGFTTAVIQSQTDTNLVHTQRIRVSATAVEEDPSCISPSSTPTLTIHPNPARDQVTFLYELANASPVSLRIYDLIGRVIRHIDLGVQGEGRHVQRWDLGDTEMGVFFCELRVGNRALTKKVIVSR
jgi:hypothetical protein